ncbi:MAG: sugar phosphate isomerase/epimerase [Clostridiales bacterium]|jgi:L-ribulose-5-phosphate 3-epimerase|nr:sugar phosphate isomerase/epimerase [Clostridiales bacterium]
MMRSFPIGVILESLRQPIPQALDTIQALGVQGVQVYATYGDLSPEKLTKASKKEFKKMVDDRGLMISALVGDLGHGFGDPEKNPGLIAKSKQILDLAKEWDTDIVTTHIGVVPEDSRHERYGIMQDACGQLAEYADSLEAHFAIETGPETAATLSGFLDSLHSTGVAVNMDPANLVMVTGDDPVQAVYTLKRYIVHTHAKDGRKLYDKDPEKIYGIVPDQVVTDPAFIELPLGEGDVPFDRYLEALRDIGYKGFLTIEREVGDQPVKDIEMAVRFLRGFF